MISNWNQIFAEQFVHVIILGIFSFFCFLLRNAFMGPVTQLTDKLVTLQTEFHEHRDECNKISKAVLVEKINNLDEKIDSISEEQLRARDRMHDLGNLINSKLK